MNRTHKHFLSLSLSLSLPPPIYIYIYITTVGNNYNNKTKSYSDAVIYRIYCQDCTKSHETSRNLAKRIKKHKTKLKSGNFSYTLVIHKISKNHKFDLQHANIITFTQDKKQKNPRIIKSSAIHIITR